MSLVHSLNGRRLPNWVYLVALGIMLGIQGSAIYWGQMQRTNDLADQITTLQKTLDRRTEQINAELKTISAKTGYIARNID